jgi:hypothetical protein
MRTLMLALFVIAGCSNSEPCDPGQKLLWAMTCVPDMPPGPGGSGPGGSGPGGSAGGGSGPGGSAAGGSAGLGGEAGGDTSDMGGDGAN